MPVTVTVAPNERAVMAFALDRVAIFCAHGTAEQRDSAQTLTEMLQGMVNTPPGAVELDFLTQDAYLLGIRIYATSADLEEYWLDACERVRGGRVATPPDPDLDLAVKHFFPDLVEDPLSWDFDSTAAIFTHLSFALDSAISTAVPRARAMYNADREEMVDKANAVHEQNARIRSGAIAVAVAAPALRSMSESVALNEGWGVDIPTGLTPDDIPAESFRPVTIGSVTVLITNYDGVLAAVQGTCSHQAASLVKGRVTGSIIQCPRHGSEFDLRSGEQRCPPFCPRWMEANGSKAAFLKLVTPDKRGGDLLLYPLRVEHGEIVIRI